LFTFAQNLRMKKKEQYSEEKLFNTIIEAIKQKKGKDIVSINLRKIENTIFDFFVICHGESTTQVGAIADAIELKAKEDLGIRPAHFEGMQNAQWVLIDFHGIIVHIFLNEKREFYRLEDLWADGEISVHNDE
jgi:ribosome-associated protein